MWTLLVVLVTLIPGLYLVLRAGDAGRSELLRILTESRVGELLANSLALVAAVTALACVVGVGLAFLVERTDLGGRRFWRAALALPLAVPSYVAAYAWVSTVRAQGFWWAVLILGLGTYPYVFLSVSAALRRANQNAEDVGRTLGLTGWQVFRRVTFPHLRPSMAAGALLVATYALSDFGAVSLLRYDSFTRAIFMSYRASFDRTTAAVLALVLMACTLAITWAEIRMRGRAGRSDATVHRNQQRVHLRGWATPAALSAGLVLILSLGYPLAVVAGWSFVGRSAGIDWPDLASAAWSTVWICTVAAAVIVLVCLPVGWLTGRSQSRASAWTQHSLYVAHALPGLVVALALVFFSVRFLEPWYQRVPVLILAYLVLFAPLAVGSIRSAVLQSSPALEDVSSTLGLAPVATFLRVTMPLAAPGVLSGFVLVLLTAMKELPATLLLKPTGVDTLATRLWMHTDNLSYAAAAPYGVALVLTAILATLALTLTERGRRTP